MDTSAADYDPISVMHLIHLIVVVTVFDQCASIVDIRQRIHLTEWQGLREYFSNSTISSIQSISFQNAIEIIISSTSTNIQLSYMVWGTLLYIPRYDPSVYIAKSAYVNACRIASWEAS